MPDKSTRLGRWRYYSMLNELLSVLSPDTVSQMDSDHSENDQIEQPELQQKNMGRPYW